ncbi:hypothetical protein [Sulfobacillus thermosulfidooxidans]|nr:hypothetical protein [Sulfobacillus thermosulfidooxidans]
MPWERLQPYLARQSPVILEALAAHYEHLAMATRALMEGRTPGYSIEPPA